MEEKSLAYEMLHTLKTTIKIILTISIIELVIIGFMAYLLYDSQFEYSTEQEQDLSNTLIDNSSIELNQEG